MKILVTGANGFVGRALCQRVQSEPGMEAVGSVRDSATSGVAAVAGSASIIAVPQGLTADADWSIALRGIDVVVHTAARVHVMNDTSDDPLAQYRRVNVQGTMRLARQAADAGVRRFVFVSTVKVNGESTPPERPFLADDVPAPVDPYGISKWEAEQGLRHIAEHSGMQWVVIRPPLVYGPGVKANFAMLLRTIQRRWPLPLGAVRNQRSYVALDNLVDFIVACLRHPQAANQTFLVSDGQDMSTRDLALGLARAAGVPARLLPVPVWLLQLGAAALGRSGMAQRLCGNLQLDISKSKDLLGWSAPVSVIDGLRMVVAGGGGNMKRLFDVVLALVAALVLLLPFLSIALLVRLTSPGPVLFWSDRVGRNNKIFRMPKFRSMRVDTPAVATHLLQDPGQFLTPVGGFLRRSSLDELPQLLSIICGDMSFVGPRPALFNQDDLVAQRSEKGVHVLVPGLTGWAQINGRDELPIPQKVALDAEYLRRRSFWFDLKILVMTFVKVLRRDNVTH